MDFPFFARCSGRDEDFIASGVRVQGNFPATPVVGEERVVNLEERFLDESPRLD